MNKGKKCYVFGSAEAVYPKEAVVPDKGSLYIAADGGYSSMKAASIVPSVILGDFDSCELTDEMKKLGAEIIVHPIEKDDTDLMLAIKLGFERGYTDFVIVGCLGGARFDHSIATLQALGYVVNNGGSAVAYGKGEDGAVMCAQAIKDGSITLPSRENGHVSVFSLSERSEGVSINGLKYSVAGAILTPFFPLGVSNSFVGREASISVDKGTLIVIY